MTELKKTIRESRIEYTLVGDYYIPNLVLSDEERSIGWYGRMHRDFLKEARPNTYNDLLLTGRLWGVLADLNEQAEERLDVIVRQIAVKEGVTEELKKRDQLEWVRLMNGVRSRAEEIILNEMVYV